MLGCTWSLSSFSCNKERSYESCSYLHQSLVVQKWSFGGQGSRRVRVWLIQNRTRQQNKMLQRRVYGLQVLNLTCQIEFLDIDCVLCFYNYSVYVLHRHSLKEFRRLYIYTLSSLCFLRLCVFLFYVYGCSACICICILCTCLVPTQEGIRSGTRVTSSCEPPHGTFVIVASTLNH